MPGFLATVAAAALLLVGCSQPTEGMSHVEVDDLPDGAFAEFFDAEPTPMTAELVQHDNGCVLVIIDGVERVPLWPDGTSAKQDADNLSLYRVVLPGGAELLADTEPRPGFTAEGVISSTPGPYTQPPDSAVDSHLQFCQVPAEPVAFPDAGSFDVQQSDQWGDPGSGWSARVMR